MLVVTGTADTDLPCNVEVDPYLAISFKTYPEILPGARYFRIGNFDVSLLEIGIDPSSLAIRSVCLVGFDKMLTREQVGEGQDQGLEVAMGLPVVSSTGLSGDRTDEPCEFGVCLIDNSFVIDWSHGKSLSKAVQFQRVRFYLAERELRRIVFCELTSSETALLSEHLSAASQ